MNININSPKYFNNVNRIQSRKYAKVSAQSFGSDNTKPDKLTSSLDALSEINKPLIHKKATIIQPLILLEDPLDFYKDRILSQFSSPKGTFVYDNDGDIKIKPKYNPKKLEIINKRMNTEHISNAEFPSGTIAISSDLNGKLSTDGLLQCIGVAFVDRKNDLQTLLHFCPLVITEHNEEVLKHILSASNPEDLEITVVPGKYKETDLSIEFLYDKLDKLSKGSTVNFAEFPDSEHDTLVLNEGNVFAAPYNKLIKDINPLDRLTFASCL